MEEGSSPTSRQGASFGSSPRSEEPLCHISQDKCPGVHLSWEIALESQKWENPEPALLWGGWKHS